MSTTCPITAPFELAGSYGGFVFTSEGKRRLMLRADGRDSLLKVPRLLRRRMIGKFAPGEQIRVAGTEETDPDTGKIRRVVDRVLPPDAAPAPLLVDRASVSGLPAASAATLCTISVCTKKSCWRRGGSELWDALVRERAAAGLADRVELRQTGCLDRCKHGPNADAGRREHSRCSPRDAAAILAQAAGLAPLSAR